MGLSETTVPAVPAATSTAIVTPGRVDLSQDQRLIVAVFPSAEAGGKPMPSFVKITPAGAVRNMFTRVPLSIERGEMFDMRGKLHLTAAGYNKLNLFAGVWFVTPETCRDDNGADRRNPCIERGDDGHVQLVRVRMIAVGRVPTGNLVRHDLTVNFDLRTYFAQDLWSKWLGGGDKPPKTWGVALPGKDKPADHKNWKNYAMPMGVTLWVDLSSREVLDVLKEHFTRQKFAERNAQTICRRNLLKYFLAADIVDKATLMVGVTSWPQVDRDFVQQNAFVAAAADGLPHQDEPQMESVVQTLTVDTPEEVQLGTDPTDDDEFSLKGGDTEEPEPQTTQRDPCFDLRSDIRALIQHEDFDGDASLESWEKEWGKLGDCKNPDVMVGLRELLERRQLEIVQARTNARRKPKGKDGASNG